MSATAAAEAPAATAEPIAVVLATSPAQPRQDWVVRPTARERRARGGGRAAGRRRSRAPESAAPAPAAAAHRAPPGAAQQRRGGRASRRRAARRRARRRPPTRASCGRRKARARSISAGVKYDPASTGAGAMTPARAAGAGARPPPRRPGRPRRRRLSPTASASEVPTPTAALHAGRHRLRHPRQPPRLRGRARGRRPHGARPSSGASATSSATAPTPTTASRSRASTLRRLPGRQPRPGGHAATSPLDEFSRGAALAAALDAGGHRRRAPRVAGLADAPPASADGVGLYHASPRDPIWEYVLSTLLAELCLDAQRRARRADRPLARRAVLRPDRRRAGHRARRAAHGE